MRIPNVFRFSIPFKSGFYFRTTAGGFMRLQSVAAEALFCLLLYDRNGFSSSNG